MKTMKFFKCLLVLLILAAVAACATSPMVAVVGTGSKIEVPLITPKPPAPPTPPALITDEAIKGQLTGKWSDVWQGGSKAYIEVVEVDTVQKRVKGIYAWERGPGISFPGQIKFDVDLILGPGELPKFKFSGGRAITQYEFVLKNDKLLGERIGASGRNLIVMKKQ